MNKQFDQKSLLVMMLAQEEASRLGKDCLKEEHLLLGLLGEGIISDEKRQAKGIASMALNAKGLTLRNVRIQAEAITGRGSNISQKFPLSSLAKDTLELAEKSAEMTGDEYIKTEHIMLGLLQLSEGSVKVILKNLNIEALEIEEEIYKLKEECIRQNRGN